jgi:signal transduction histidine kinase
MLPALQVATRAPSLHVALETASALVASLGAYLSLGRYRRSRLLPDLLLVAALSFQAYSSVFFAAFPAAVNGGASSVVSGWAATSSGACAAALFAASAFVPRERVKDMRRARMLTMAGLLACLTAILVSAIALRNVLPPLLESGVDSGPSDLPELVGHPLVLSMQLLGFLLFAAAAVGFARRSNEMGDWILRWLGVAAILGAAARLSYFLYPSIYSDWVYTGDAFRLLFYLAVLGAAALEIRSYWNSVAEVAVLEERRRLARDLHDGLAQELGYVLRNLRRLDTDDRLVQRIESGVRRAVDESRRAIAALTEPLDEPLDVALARAARDAARRVNSSVVLDVTPGIELDRDARETLVRIAAEAVTNAGRHGGASLIRVHCTNGDRIRLRVSDSGRGFDPAAPGNGSGFGLIAMRERAETIGAEFAVASTLGAGTEIRVTL